MLKNIGLQKPVDDFVLSMNRAAEAASPQGNDILLSAVQKMTFDDAKNVLNGGDTVATDYLKEKTFNDISGAFKSIVSDTVNQVGVTSAYKDMTGRFLGIPFASSNRESLIERKRGLCMSLRDGIRIYPRRKKELVGAGSLSIAR